MTLKRMTNKEMREYQIRHCSGDYVATRERMLEGAQAQLEADQKKYKELKDELEYLYESYEVVTEVLDLEHNAVIREIESKLVGIFREADLHFLVTDGDHEEYRKFLIEAIDKALKQKYLGGK